MSHSFRFIGERTSDLNWSLSSEEWQHLLKVLRLERGDLFEITNGAGWVGVCRLESIGKNLGSFICLSEHFWKKDSLPGRQVTLIVGALKPQSVDDFLPALIELGIDRIWVFGSDGSDKARISDKIQERWFRIAVSATKQSKRPWLPEIKWFEDLQSAIESAADKTNGMKFYLDAEATQYLSCIMTSLDPVCAVIGSEKGFTSSEYELMASAGFVGAKMNSFVLKASTANIAAAAILKNI